MNNYNDGFAKEMACRDMDKQRGRQEYSKQVADSPETGRIWVKTGFWTGCWAEKGATGGEDRENGS